MKTCTMISPKEIHQNALDHGWYDFQPKLGYDDPETGVKKYAKMRPESCGPDFVAAKLALIHSELSEALEVIRETPANIELAEVSQFSEEMADVIIRVFDLCEFLGVDIIGAVHAKHAINKDRPYKHGGKQI